MGAPVGNRNAVKGRRWQEALDKALKRFADKDAGIKAGQALDRIAKVVVQQALDGDRNAIQEIGNRLDGKPHQSMEVAVDDVRPKTKEEIVATAQALGMDEETLFDESFSTEH